MRVLYALDKQKTPTYVFSIPEDVTTTINSGVATFDNVDILQGTYLSKQFIVDGSLDQRFILDNSFIDTSTIRVNVKTANDTGLGRPFTPSDNILNIDKNSENLSFTRSSR